MYNGTSRVLTQENGLTRIDSLEEREYNFWTGSEWVFKPLHNLGKAVGVRLEAESGVDIECAMDLPLFYERKSQKCKKLMLTKHLDGFEVPLNSDWELLHQMERYNVGLLLAKIHDSLIEDGRMKITYLEKEFDLIRDFKKLIKPVSNFESKLKFRRFKPHKVFFFLDNVNLQDLRKFPVPDEIYRSYEAAKGYIAGLFEEARVSEGTLRIAGYRTFLEQVQEVLLLFGIRSRVKKGLFIDPRDIGRFCFRIPVRAEKLRLQLPKIWGGYQGASNPGVNVKRVARMRKDIDGFYIESPVMVNGVIV